MSHKVLLSILLSLSPLLNTNGKYYYFQKITEDSDFTFGPVRTLCEDEDGLIWFGCNNGLYHHNTISVEKATFALHDKQASQSFNINKIYRDSQNHLWVGSEKGLFKLNKSNNLFEKEPIYVSRTQAKALADVKNIIEITKGEYVILSARQLYHYTLGDSIAHAYNHTGKNNIAYLSSEEDGNIFFATIYGDLYISKDKLKTASLLYKSNKGGITSICKDGNKYLVGYTGEGIDIINIEGTKISELNHELTGEQHLLNNRIRKIIKRKNGEIWIGTHIGIIVMSQGQQTLLNSKIETGLSHRSIYTMYQGRNESIWVGTFAGGVAYYNESNYAFSPVSIHYDKKLQMRSTVSSFCEDGDHHIWVGSEDEGSVLVYNPDIRDFTDKFDPQYTSQLKSIKALSYIGNNTIAIGRIFSNELVLYNYKNKVISSRIKLPRHFMSGIFATSFLHPTLWITGRRSIYEYNVETKELKESLNIGSVNSSGRIWDVFLDSSHNLWISTDDGLYMKSKGSDSTKICFKPNAKYDLSKETVYTVCEDSNGDIWVGTKGKGVFIYAYENNSLRPAPDYDLAKNTDIHSLLKDKEGNIWYNTNKGLFRYNESDNTTSHFSTIDGLPSEHIRPNSAMCSESGHLYFGSINGFSVINPSIVKENKIAPKVLLTEIKINNEDISKDNIIYANSLTLSQIKEIKLKPDQNSFDFKVISNNYIKSEKNKFMYRLLNYNDNWVEVGQNHNISFTRVPPGKYVLEVLGSNNDNLWSNVPYCLDINIRKPHYKRWYAILSYFLIISVVFILILKDVKTKLMLKKEITAERYKSQANDIIYAERLKFFTNISHELRTPLSLIISPIRSLLDKASNDEQTKDLLKVVDRNAKRLLKLTDQTLDLRLLEVGKLEPNFDKNDIIEIAKDVYLCFEHQIIDRQINFSFTSDFQKIEAIIDGDMIEKVIYNLLSNALKYTEEKGHIFLCINKKELTKADYEGFICSGEQFTGKAIEIIVRDTGKGIKAQQLPHIFERFAKGSEAHQSSSGIGLHMCKEYSEMNDGNILITSNEGIGSSFILNLPVKENFNFETNKRKEIIKHDFTQVLEDEETTPIKKDAFRHTILLAEDNSDLRGYFKTFLSKRFKVITTKSGEEALDVISDLMPDILITDVSMPGMSGIELTQKLKEDPLFQHIPIIVMTAHTEREYQMESILRGADAFLTKPIEESLLLAHINNILSKKQAKPKAKTKQEEDLSDQSFIVQVEKIIEANLHNPKFGINDILEVLNISKSTLDRRIKSETQQNPSGFIRDIRLKNAIKLMNTNKFNIDEIATYVGFNSSSYFIRTFKGKYGITPREYKKENITNDKKM